MAAQQARQLSDRSCLSRAVDADDEYHFGTAHTADRNIRRSVQNADNLLLQQPLELVHIADLFVVRALPQSFEYLASSATAKISGNQRRLQIVQRTGIDLFVEGDDLLDAVAEVLARARDRLLHPIQETWFFVFFLFEAAE